MTDKETLKPLRASIPADLLVKLEAFADVWGLPISWAARQALLEGLKAITRSGWSPARPQAKPPAAKKPAKAGPKKK